MAKDHPEWKSTEPFRSVLAGDLGAVLNAGETGIGEIIAVTHSGQTTGAFNTEVAHWFATAREPRFDRPTTR